eukprot:5647605-Pleurochrysis_carterae.AAC.1
MDALSGVALAGAHVGVGPLLAHDVTLQHTQHAKRHTKTVLVPAASLVAGGGYFAGHLAAALEPPGGADVVRK